MDWIFEHIWVLVAIAAVIARLLNKRKEGDASPGEQPAQPKEYEFEDAELAERTRKIRDEIQRKIAERRGQHMQPPVLPSEQTRPAPLMHSPEATTPPATLPEIFRELRKPKPQPDPPHSRRMMQVNAAEELERQATLAERLKEAKLMKAAAERRVAFEESTSDKEPVALQKARTVVLDDLRSPQALRRAFVLREVLGPPVALR